MVEHTEENIGDDDFPIFTTNLNHLIDRGYPRGYAAALEAAREAVAAMEIAVVGNSAATVDQALAVIESLRKGSND